MHQILLLWTIFLKNKLEEIKVKEVEMFHNVFNLNYAEMFSIQIAISHDYKCNYQQTNFTANSVGSMFRHITLLLSECLTSVFLAPMTKVQRFKASAVKAAVDQSSRRRVADASRGLIQVVVDNFDANIASQNGLVSTHSLAMLLAFKDETAEAHTDDTTIRRLTRDEMKIPAAEDIAVFSQVQVLKKRETPVKMVKYEEMAIQF